MQRAATILAGLGAAAFLLLAYYGALFAAHRGDPGFLKIDTCLDRGGRWNYETRTCER